MNNYLSIFLLSLFCISSTIAQTDRAIKDGFGIKLNLSSPGSNYGLESPILADFNGQYLGILDFNSGFLLGLQLGNVWYFNPQEKFGIGLMANWMDFTIAFATDDGEQIVGSFQETYSKLTFDFTLLEVGPVATLKLKENMALDAYYNLRPTTYISMILGGFSSEDMFSVAFGPTHAIGLAFRYKVLYLGPEIVFGKLKDRKVRSIDDSDIVLYTNDIKATHFRFVAGVKF